MQHKPLAKPCGYYVITKIARETDTHFLAQLEDGHMRVGVLNVMSITARKGTPLCSEMEALANQHEALEDDNFDKAVAEILRLALLKGSK